MTNLVVVFLTGLTTGGLSCLAVQGGLLASSVAQQAEQNIQKQLEAKRSARNAAQNAKMFASLIERPKGHGRALPGPSRCSWARNSLPT